MRALFFLYSTLSVITLAYGEPLVIVANHSFKQDSLAPEELKSFYTAQKFRIENQKIILVNLPIDHGYRERFEKKILEVDREILTKVWLQAHYLGYRPPKVFKSQESIAEFISKVDNTLGYMDEATAQKYHLKILFKESEQ